MSLIRTGSEAFSHHMVTIKHNGGGLPSWAKVDGGAVKRGREIIPTPEEADFFRVCDMAYVRPEDRNWK